MTGIFYGSTTGHTEAVAGQLARLLGLSDHDIYNVGSCSAAAAEAYDVLLLGSSTWGAGDVQDDWYDFLDQLSAQDLRGKKVALFGCGDSESYPDTFCGALAQLYDRLQPTGCTFVGFCEPGGDFLPESDVLRGGHLLGLTLDDNTPERHEAQLAAWCKHLLA